MRMARFFLQVALIALMCGSALAAPPPDPPAGDGTPWMRTWTDEFDGPDHSLPDPEKWVLESGGGGWGNHELQTYTTRPANLSVEGGHLVIRALRERHTGADGIERSYTSARMKTLGRFSQAYGRFEARLQVPYGQGIWPAFWMLGDDIEKAGWPTCGEIDVMENIGREPTVVHGTIHGPGYSGGKGIGTAVRLPSEARFADGFHEFAVEWEPQALRFYLDGTLYATRTPADLPAGAKWVFDHPFFIILNVAVGGDWPGKPDATTTFPQVMRVDYVRVYRRGEPAVRK